MSRRVERAVTAPGEPARLPAAGRTCGAEAGPAWCEHEVFARGLCRPHYRRVAKGLALDPDDGHQVGVTPSGHGTWGVLDVDLDGRLTCHECGRTYVALGVHVAQIHDGTRAYRLAHGIAMSTPLATPALSARLAQATATNGGSQRIAATRRPLDALTHIDPELLARGQRIAGRHHPRREDPAAVTLS